MINNGRRRFLGVCLGGVTAAAAGAVAIPVFKYLAPKSMEDTSGKITIPEKDVPEGEAKFFEYSGSAAVIVRRPEKGYIALSAVCTHLGCIVQWEKEKQSFICPCHAGRYSSEGTVISGPPPKPLVKLPIHLTDGMITIG